MMKLRILNSFMVPFVPFGEVNKQWSRVAVEAFITQQLGRDFYDFYVVEERKTFHCQRLQFLSHAETFYALCVNFRNANEFL